MVNVNKIILWFILPLLFLIYFSYLVFDYLQFSNGNMAKILSQHERNILNHKVIDGVILGGSNAAYGLSAELLTKKSGSEWINISILNEAYSDKNYWEFLDKNITQQQRLSIKKVIYSSITPLFSDNDYQLRVDNIKDIYGRKPFGLIPINSLISYIRHYATNNHDEFPIPNLYGDFNFNQFKCELNNSSAHGAGNNTKEIERWTANQISQLRKLFPNATIYFIIPSQFYSQDFNKSKISKVTNEIENYITQYNIEQNSKIIFIDQDDIPSKDFICDLMHHPNEEGRRWRTYNLIKQIY